MKCPYCNDDMEFGYIKAAGEKLSWTPENEKRPMTRWGISKNGIELGAYSFFSGSCVNAAYCPACKKVIINT